ncbi:MAG: lysophospholipid acyltransferase family protein [Bacteroidales bacterium]|nr:lysophospholipid acyltransferase family protein [Bacteroidales bacterium]
MSEWEGKSKGNATGYKIFIALINFFGLNTAYLILNFVALYFFLFSLKSKKYILWYFRNIHQFSYWKSQKYTFKNFYAIGVSILDKVALLSGNDPKFSFDFDGEKHFHQLAQEGNGGIIVGAHIGNWEIAGQLMSRIDIKVNIVMKLNEDEAINEVIEKAVHLKQMNIINITDDFSYLIKIKKALDKNEFVILHGDRFVDDSNIAELDFMGHKADFPMGPFLLALKFRKPITFAFAMKESNKHYHFYATKPISNLKRTNPKELNEKTIELMNDYTLALKKMLHKYPEQWFNYYKFWK